MKTAREVAHDIVKAKFGEVRCYDDDHTTACTVATAAIEARDTEHDAESADTLERVGNQLGRERDTARAALEVATTALERLRDIAHDNRDWGMRTIAKNALEAISRLAAPPDGGTTGG